MNFLQELEWRGMLYQTAGAQLEKHLEACESQAGGLGRVGYCGFDPTADSLTVGNFNSIKLLRHWQDAGHKPVVLMGGGTGLIGDPSGKDAERKLLTPEQVQSNVESISRIFERVLDFDPSNPNCAVIVDNADWLCKLGYIDVLRDVGKHFSVNVMMQKESVKERLHNRDQGISYTEFSYMILQAYDFLHLRKHHNCTVQIAGSDQYGNVIAGMDLIRREFGAEEGESFGVTSSLVTRSDGKKFGKSESGAIWLTADRTSPYQFYQFWINTEDSMVVAYLKRFTMLDQERIAELTAQHEEAPQQRHAHRALAQEMTSLLHGAEAVSAVENATGALFGRGDIRELSASMLGDVFADVPHSSHELHSLSAEGVPLAELLAETSLAQSRRQAREFLNNGAVAVNGQKVSADYMLRTSDLLHSRTILLRRGKKNWHATQWQ